MCWPNSIDSPNSFNFWSLNKFLSIQVCRSVSSAQFALPPSDLCSHRTAVSRILQLFFTIFCFAHVCSAFFPFFRLPFCCLFCSLLTQRTCLHFMANMTSTGPMVRAVCGEQFSACVMVLLADANDPDAWINRAFDSADT